MGKPSKERKLPDDAAMARAAALRTSARKLNLVAASIRGKSAAQALTQLEFEKRRIAKDVRKVLMSAIANAENNHGLDVDRLYVSEAWVGRSIVMKRFRARARGRSAAIEKPFSNLTIVVKERGDDESKKGTAEKIKTGKQDKTTKKGAAQAAAAEA